MWIFTRYGFFSVVCPKQGGKPVRGKLMVRARSRAHLEALVERFPRDLGGTEIQTTTTTDYRYRMIVPARRWGIVLAALAEEVDYTNFKGECSQVTQDEPYLDALHRVWDVMYSLQPATPSPEPLEWEWWERLNQS